MRILLHSDEKRGEAFPKLGLGYLISFINRYYPGVEFEVSFAKEDVFQKIQDFKPALIGFTALTYRYKDVFSLARSIKERFPSIPLIIGGTHISLFAKDLPEYFDVAVIGEGEETFLEIVRSFNEGNGLKRRDIKGIAFRKDKEIVITEPREPIEPLDRIPPPDFDKSGIARQGPAYLMTSRGCPFRCSFCTSKWFFKKPRFHSAEYVVNEIEKFVSNFKRRNVRIYDDLFSMDKKRVKDIADLIAEKGLSGKLDIDAICHVKYIDEEVLESFKKIGITAVSLGMESGSPRIIEYLKKGTVTLDKIREVVRLCKKHDIYPMGSFMIGSPHERKEDVQATIDFIKEIELGQIGVCVTTPFPGTEIWEYGKKAGLIKSDEWDDRLWGFHDVNEENVKNKIILADMDKETFFKMYRKLHDLSLSLDWKREIRKWLKQPYNLRLLLTHIKGRIKPYKKRLKRKIRKLFTKNK
ncbi:B12-binding domain-containing radical SAM protein [Candidatus Omnitrophota bacterium]